MFVIFPFFPIFFVWEGKGSWPLLLISIDKGRIKTKFKIFAKVRVNYSMLFKIFVISYNVDIFPSQQVFFPLPISSVTKTYIYILFVKKFQYFCPIYPLKSRRLKFFFFFARLPLSRLICSTCRPWRRRWRQGRGAAPSGRPPGTSPPPPQRTSSRDSI